MEPRVVQDVERYINGHAYPVCVFRYLAFRLGLRCSASGLRRRFGSGAGYQVPGAR